MSDIDIERVLRAAGPRNRPPEEVESRAREHLHKEWLQIVAEEHTRRRRRINFALAAGLVAAAIGVWLAAPLVTRSGGEAAATIALVSGEIRAKSGWLGPWRLVGDGESVTAGETLTTGTAGRVAVTLPGGVSARLDRDTRITFVTAEMVRIESGALYVDAGRAAASPARLEVVTPHGSLTHLGTQFEVRLLESQVRVRVREGRVEWRNDRGAVASGTAGEQLTIEPDGVVQRGATSRFGESWDWVAAVAPGIDIDGHSLAEFLEWAGRELGRDVIFASAEVRSEATGVVLHGSIAGLTPLRALDVVIATTQLQLQLDDGRILIGPQESGGGPSVNGSSAEPAT